MINKVILMGRLTRDPELRYTGTGKPVCSFTIAVDGGYGETKKTEFINCVAWKKTAEFADKYFSKGSMVIIDGRITTRTWEDSTGKMNYTVEVTVQTTAFGEAKKKTEQKEKQTEGPDSDFNDLLDADSDLPF